MFALIYNELVNDSQTYFLENSVVTKDLSFSLSVYFSTITTLGYGDITPVGFYRFFAMTEVILELIYGRTIIYFLTRAFK